MVAEGEIATTAPRAEAAEPLDVSVLSGLVSFHLRMLLLEVNRAYDRAFAGTAMAGGTGKLTTLMLVAANPGMSQGHIGTVLNKDRPAMARIVAHLEAEGLIRRQRPPAERRRYGLFLTPRGRANVARYMRTAQSYDEDFFGGLTRAERATFTRLLRKLRVVHQAHTLGLAPDAPTAPAPGGSRLR